MKNRKPKTFIATSNDIIWDGEDLPCISLCNGDAISDIVYKLAVQICAIKKSLDLKDIDLKTVFAACLGCPSPVKTLDVVLQLIINKIATIDQVIATLNSGSASAVPTDIVLASCFLPQYNGDGDSITKLPQADYTRLIATMVCSTTTAVNGILSRVQTLETQVSSILSQIAELEAEPVVTPTCVATGPMEISEAYTLLETAFCQLRGTTGLPSAIVSGISKQPSTLKDEIQLSGAGNAPMSVLTGWKNSVSTLGDSLANLWLTTLDNRAAIRVMMDNCCKVNCDSIVVDFSIKLNDERTQATLFFASKCKIPVGFSDCNPNGNILTITDSDGGTTDVLVKLSSVTNYSLVGGVMTEPSVVVDLLNTSINPQLDFFFNMDACLTNGDMTCQKCINKTVTYKDTCSYCEITVYTKESDPTAKLIVGVLENNVKRYITIRQGETNVIKKSAKIIEVVNYGNVTYNSLCTLPAPTATSCYVVVIAAPGTEGGETQFGEAGNTCLMGFEVNGILAAMPAGPICSNADDGSFVDATLLDQLKLIPNLDIVDFTCIGGFVGDSGSLTDPSDRGKITYITFRTTPSFAAIMTAKIRTSAPLGGAGTSVVYYYLPVYSYEKAQDLGYTGLCDCTDSIS